MSEYKHIHKDYLKFMSNDGANRIQLIREPIWINYPKTKELHNSLETLMSQPKKYRMQNLLIIGESNIGKTTIVRKFIDKYPDLIEEDEFENSYTVKPIIYAQFPASGDEKGLYITILEQLWAPFRVTEPTIKLRHQTIDNLRKCQVKMLIFDEIHNLLGGTPAKQRIVMNVLKNLTNELCIPIVGVGTKDAALILHSDSQHASRFDVVELPRWQVGKEFRSLLKSFEERVLLKKPSNLYSKEKGVLLYSICEGNLGDLSRLIVECAICAIEEGTEEITVDVINKFRWLKPTKGVRSRGL